MKASKLERIDDRLFRALDLKEQVQAIGGGYSYLHTNTLTNSAGKFDVVSDTKVFDVTPDQT
jgi:hypothetical protein